MSEDVAQLGERSREASGYDVMPASVPPDIVELEAAFDADRTVADWLDAALVTKTSAVVPNE